MDADEAQRVLEHPPPSILSLPVDSRSRPQSAIIGGGGWKRDRRVQHAGSVSGATGGASDGEADEDRELLRAPLRQRHMTVSGVDAPSAQPQSPGALGAVAPNAVPMRRISLLQRQNRDMLDVS